MPSGSPSSSVHLPQAALGAAVLSDPLDPGTTGILRALLHHEAATLRAMARSSPPPSMGRTVYQGLIAVTRPLIVWTKWAIEGAFTPPRPAHSRSSLLDLAVRAARENEATAGPGLWLEFGVYRGESLRRIAAGAPRTVFGFDSFEGLPEDWGPGHPRGKFSLGTAVPLPPPNSEFVPGLFDATLPSFLDRRPQDRASFVHVDCDLYESARTVLGELASRLKERAVLVFDEFCGLLPDDEARAFREFLRSTGLRFRYLGLSYEGAVAVELTSPGGRPSWRERGRPATGEPEPAGPTIEVGSAS